MKARLVTHKDADAQARSRWESETWNLDTWSDLLVLIKVKTRLQTFRQLKEYTRGIPDYNFQVGDIRFIRAKKKKEAEKENEEDFKAFEGTGQSLRQAKKK